MNRARKDADIRARVDSTTRQAIEQIAEREHLELSDIIRRAVREFVQRNVVVAK